MPRPKFRITVDNLMHAARYLDGRLGSQAFVPSSMSAQEGRTFVNQILMSPKTQESAERLQTWCSDNLEPKVMRALQLAVRKRKQRTRTTNYRVLTVSSNAYGLLRKLAKRDNVTLSQALEKSIERSLRRTGQA